MDAQWVWDVPAGEALPQCQPWFYLRQNFSERGMRAERGSSEGVKGSVLEGCWPCRSRLCPARAAARSTRGGSSQGLCSHWSLKSQTFHNAPSHCRKAEQGCESTWRWELSKWKHCLPAKCLSDLTVTVWGSGIIVCCVQSCSLHCRRYLQILGFTVSRFPSNPFHLMQSLHYTRINQRMKTSNWLWYFFILLYPYCKYYSKARDLLEETRIKRQRAAFTRIVFIITLFQDTIDKF